MQEVWAHGIAHLPDPPTPRLFAAYMEALLSVGLPDEAFSVFRSAPELGTEPDSQMYALAIDACSQTDSILEWGGGPHRNFGEGSEYGESMERNEGSFDEYEYKKDSLGEEVERRTDLGGRALGDEADAETGDGESSEAELGAEAERTAETEPDREAEPKPERTADTKPESGAGMPGVSGGPSSTDAERRGALDEVSAEPSAEDGKDWDGNASAGVAKPGTSGRNSVTNAGKHAVSNGVSETQTGFARARQLYHDVLAKRLPLSRNVFLATLRVCLKHGELREALEVPDQMVAAGVKADTRIYNHLLLVCSAAGNWAAGVTVKQRMVSEGVKPDRYTFNIWIRFAGRCQKTDEAVAAFEEMGELRLERTVVTWNALIGALGAGRRWREALAAFRKLQGVSDGVERVVRERVRRRGGEGIREELQEEVETGVREGVPGEVSEGVSVVIEEGLQEGPQERNGQRVAEGAPNELREGVKEGVTKDFIGGSGEGNGRWVRKWIRKGVRKGAGDPIKPSVATYDIVIRLLARAGRVREGLEVLGEMRRAGFRPDARVYNALGEALYVGKEWETFLRLVEAMRKQGLECNDALSGRVRIVQRRLAKEGRRESEGGLEGGGRYEGVSEGGKAGAGFVEGVSGGGREDGSEGGGTDGNPFKERSGPALDLTAASKTGGPQDGNEARLSRELDAGDDESRAGSRVTDMWQSLADDGDETDDEFDGRRAARRGVDWRRVTGVPYRAPRDVTKWRRRRARVAGRRVKEWVNHTGRGTSQDLVKLLSGDLGNLDRVDRERTESRYVDRFGSAPPSEEERVAGD